MSPNASPTDLALPLPIIRPDLEFYPGEEDIDGSPTWKVHDPLTGIFRKFGWAEAAIMRRMGTGKTLGELVVELARFTTLNTNPDEVVAFCEDLEREGLTVSSSVTQAEKLEEQARARKLHPIKWLLLHYLYIRIPLLHPDRFLTRTLPLVRPLASIWAFAVYLVVFAAGLFLLLQHSEDYLRTFPYFFNPEGVLAYMLAIVGVKVIHEFSHAYTAKAHGVRVPTMGMAFLVLCPVAFCDVTDGWKLPRRGQRFLISVAGIAAEMVIAGLALFMWGISGTGIMKSVFFVLSSVTLLSAMLVNINPAMRFDGYYILGDLWGIDNLRERAFAMSRWALRKWLLGIKMEPPEPAISGRRLCGMMVYSFYSWAYRVLLYLGIAVLVYYKFTKILGIILFVFEVGWFLCRPVFMEIKALIRLRRFIHLNRNLLITGTILSGILLWAGLPLRRDLATAAVVEPRLSQVLYAPSSGTLVDIRCTLNSRVKAGDVLAAMTADRLDARIRIAKIEVARLEQDLVRIIARKQGKAQLRRKREELRQARGRLLAARQQQERNIIRARITGTVCRWDRSLHPPTTVKQDQVLGKIANLNTIVVKAFVSENNIRGIRTGDRVNFVSRNHSRPCPGTISSILPLREKAVQYKSLTSTMHGDLPVRRTMNGQLLLVGSFYQVEIELSPGHPPMKIGQTGRVWIRTMPRSLLLEGLRYAWRVMVKESGF